MPGVAADVFLHEQSAIDRIRQLAVLRCLQYLLGCFVQPHAETLAAAVRLDDQWAACERRRRIGQRTRTDHRDRLRHRYAFARQLHVLARLADFKIERASVIDDDSAMPPEPCEHRGGELRRVSMVA